MKRYLLALIFMGVATLGFSQTAKIYMWMGEYTKDLTLVSKAGDTIAFNEFEGLVAYTTSKLGKFKVLRKGEQIKDEKSGLNLLWDLVAGKTYYLEYSYIDNWAYRLSDISSLFKIDSNQKVEVWGSISTHIGSTMKTGVDVKINLPSFFPAGSYPIFVNGVPFTDDFNEPTLFSFTAGAQIVIDEKGKYSPFIVVDMDKKSDKVFKVGDLGPAGGIIVFDKGYVSLGWQYLEVGPKDLGSMKWDEAITACKAYDFSGFKNWRLPNKNEMNLMYLYVHKKGIGGFNNNNDYWSSSEYNSDNAWSQFFGNGQQNNYPKDLIKHSPLVRPIRAF